MERYQYSDSERSLMENSMVPFAVYQFIDKRVVTLVLSKGFCELFSYDDMSKAYYDMDNDMYRDTHPDDAARIADAAFHFATEGGKYDVIYRSLDKERTGYNIIHAHGKHVYTDTGVRLAEVWYTDEGHYSEEHSSEDSYLTESLKTALFEESMLKASYYDHLTGLPGMTYFFELATTQRAVIKAEGGRPAMMYMDFSGMKFYNHKYGFASGDELLKGFAHLISDRFGNNNCCRLGQDHFAVIAETEGIEDKLNKLFDDCRLLNENHSLPIHVGIYQHWFDGIAASMACDRAKMACDTMHNTYSSRFSYYDLDMKETEDRQQYIISNLDKAIEEHWIKVYYQPIVRAVNGRVCDEEALARWIDPVNGFMSPGEFIPVLEDHRLIYKLDLYVVECVLQKIKTLSGAGLHIMPQSVNLSRSDFDTCDIVEEICRRVDKAGLPHSMLNVEITESVIGKDFEFMRSQIERFRELGFAVWMDDFGSGYSSLDVLQSIPFDLIKLDMRFMQKFNQGTKGKIILTEMLRMATSLGLDTVCEGVETEEQAMFLKETGCSKLQGYYFEKPIPVEKLLEKYAKGTQIGFEEPTQSAYYETIGRVNLHDLSQMSKDNSEGFDKYFDSMPMAVIELTDTKIRFARTNRSYREFMERSFGMPITGEYGEYGSNKEAADSPFLRSLLNAVNEEKTLFVTEQLPNGNTLHSCMRRVAVNPNGITAIAVALLSITYNSSGTSYENIARALAADYSNLYYVDIQTEDFIEYSSQKGSEEMAVERHGKDFFEQSRKDALEFIYSEDTESFLAEFNKDNILDKMDEQGYFYLTYRLMINSEPNYVSMKAMRMQHDPSHIIIGVTNVDKQIKQEKLMEKVHRNEMVFSRIIALSNEFICLYTVDIKTDDYIEVNAADKYKGFNFAKSGKDFFAQSLKDAQKAIYPEDLPMFGKTFSKENVLSAIENNGMFTMSYHLLIDDRPVPVELKAAIVREEDGEKIIIGIRDSNQPTE